MNFNNFASCTKQEICFVTTLGHCNEYVSLFEQLNKRTYQFLLFPLFIHFIIFLFAFFFFTIPFNISILQNLQETIEDNSLCIEVEPCFIKQHQAKHSAPTTYY